MEDEYGAVRGLEILFLFVFLWSYLKGFEVFARNSKPGIMSWIVAVLGAGTVAVLFSFQMDVRSVPFDDEEDDAKSAAWQIHEDERERKEAVSIFMLMFGVSCMGIAAANHKDAPPERRSLFSFWLWLQRDKQKLATSEALDRYLQEYGAQIQQIRHTLDEPKIITDFRTRLAILRECLTASPNKTEEEIQEQDVYFQMLKTNVEVWDSLDARGKKEMKSSLERIMRNASHH